MMTDPQPADAINTNITEQPAAVPPAPPSEPAPAAPATPAIDTGPPAWMWKADVVLLGSILVLSFLLASFTAANSEHWMQLAIGRLISEGKFSFGLDPFSMTTEGVYWVHHSWLYSLLLYQFYNLAGAAGLIVGKAILFTTAITLLCRIGWNEANRWFVLICLLVAALAVSTRLVLEPRVVSYLFLAITLFVLNRAGVFALPVPEKDEGGRMKDESDRASSFILPPSSLLWWLPPLFALWANLDVWFILGPLIVGLCWAATGLAKWFRGTGLVPGKTLVMIFGAGLLACVINPHHVNVFQMPPELAYLVLSVADPVSLPLPDVLVAAGRTMKELQKVGTTIPWTASPFALRYWQDSAAGLNVAGLAVFPLVMLGLLGFGVMAFVRPQPNAPSLQVSRFLVWLFFGILALALYRLIPFFALAAAPLTAMTLGEFMDWQMTSNAASAAQRARGLRLARLVSVPFCLLLIALAWPGWLHGPADLFVPAAHRVAWDMRADPSIQRAAEALNAIQEGKDRIHVFNGNIEMGNYLPWFAPGVKHTIDSRFPLYVGQIATYAAVRTALPDVATDTWQPFFNKHGIKHVAMDLLLAPPEPRISKWWSDPDHWRQRHADVRLFVFSWAGADKSWPTDTISNDWNRQAFGDLPPAKRPPVRGAAVPQLPGAWALYLEGLGTQPAGVTEFTARRLQFYLHHQYQPMFGLMTNPPPDKHRWPTPSCGLVVFSASLANLQAIPGGGMTLGPSLAIVLNDFTMFRPRDFGPPALPVLMVRTARQAVVDNPLSAEAHVTLATANEVVRSLQEDHWVGFQRTPRAQHPSVLRDTLRQHQLAAGLFFAAELQPDNFDHQIKLAELYSQQNLVDLALERLEKAYVAADAQLNAGKDLLLPTGQIFKPSQKDKFLKNFHESYIKPLENSVKDRLAKFESIKGSPLERAAGARLGDYQDFNQGRPQPSRLGLGKKALELLNAIDPTSLKNNEQDLYLRHTFDLLLAIGRADVVAENVKKAHGLKREAPEMYARYQLVTSGILGNYKVMDEALEILEYPLRERVKGMTDIHDKRRNEMLFLVTAAGTQTYLSTTVAAVGLRTGWAWLGGYSQAYGQLLQAKNDLGNVITLRGIAALEAGDTKQARLHFQNALAEDEKTTPFADRPIAKRYLELIEQQMPKR